MYYAAGPLTAKHPLVTPLGPDLARGSDWTACFLDPSIDDEVDTAGVHLLVSASYRTIASQ